MQTQAPTVKAPLVEGIQHRPDVKPLSDEAIRFEIDMCIGCDRCMRACPVPLSSSVSIADLNRATILDAIAPHIARFTDECVMCGSCVPVCPVDNHRDLLMLSLKQRLGISWNGQVDMSSLLNYLPEGWNIPRLLSRLREQPMFREPHMVPDNYLLHLVANSKLMTLMPGTTLMHEGEFGRELYLILEGHFALSSAGFDGHDLPVAVLQRGEYMGEHGMLTGQPRHETARAQTPAVVLEVPETVMHRLMELVPALPRFFAMLDDTRSIESILKRMALFAGIDDAGIRWIVQQAQVKHFAREERLFSEDGSNKPVRETLHILLEGFVKVARRTLAGTGRDKSDERIIAYRQHGDYFAGGLDLLGDSRAVTATAITRTRVAEIPGQALTSFFARYPEIGQRFQARLHEYRESAFVTGVLDASNDGAMAGLHALVGDGVVEGTEVLVIDLDKCIHCNECEQACARRHGHSRMNRKGMVVGNISITTACRQCQDPVCLLCSRAGIARLPGGEVYITESCIGCGICAERCPYDNISIVSLDEEMEHGEEHGQDNSLFQKFRRLMQEGAGKERGRKLLPMAPASALGPLDINTLQVPRDAVAEMRKKIAIKCDLCAGYSNQACVQACPTGAALRVQPTAFFGSTEEILRRRAE
ncbi:MAG TPA: cyclic nucleotide-binding domain-containing protein [Ktedonobacteraceae bacterium]|nr:cyclic nucleotide-binding domain-containing protein [Ktedonobacteraceae bacterium]